MTTCKNCGNQFEGNYCNSCGQTAQTYRLDWAFILHNVEHSILHLDRGIFYTVREIFLRPGVTIKKFIAGQRKKYTHPLTYLVVIAVVYFILRDLLVHVRIESPSEVDKTIAQFIYDYYSKIVIVVIIPLAALYTPIFYPGQPYNFVELFTFHCYMRGQFMIFEMVVIILNWMLIQMNITLSLFAILFLNISLNILFLAWSLKQFFNKENFWLSLSKAIGLMAMIVISTVILTKIGYLILYAIKGEKIPG